MTRTEIEASTRIFPIGKLVLEWMARQEHRIFDSREIARALGIGAHEVAENGHFLRRTGLMLARHEGVDLQLGALIISPEARAAYRGDEKKTAAKKAAA